MQAILVIGFLTLSCFSFTGSQPVGITSLQPSGMIIKNTTTQNAGTLTGNLNVAGITQLQNGGTINENTN